MDSVQYKGYIILIKHYAAFRHKRRDYPEVFDYIILRGKEKAGKGYGFNSAEDAITEAKRFIDHPIFLRWLGVDSLPQMLL